MKKLLVAVTALLGVLVAYVGGAGLADRVVGFGRVVRHDPQHRLHGAVHRPGCVGRPAAGPLGQLLRQAVQQGPQDEDQARQRGHAAGCCLRHGRDDQGREGPRLEQRRARRRRPGRLAGERGRPPDAQGRRLAWATGSATADRLVEAKNGTRGYFFRAVPPDSKQGSTVANLIISKLKSKNIHIIDDQETYSTGLADVVQAKLKAAGKTVTRAGVSQQESDFSALIADIDRNTDLIYIPWQLSDKAKAFGQQLKQAGRNTTLMGSDGLFVARLRRARQQRLRLDVPGQRQERCRRRVPQGTRWQR